MKTILASKFFFIGVIVTKMKSNLNEIGNFDQYDIKDKMKNITLLIKKFKELLEELFQLPDSEIFYPKDIIDEKDKCSKRIDLFVKMRKQDKKTENFPVFMKELQFMIEQLIKGITEEFKKQHLFLISKNTLFSFEKMKDGAKSFVKASKWELLIERDKYDLKEGMKCILFDLCTSAGMILMRVAESLVRIYYERIKSEPTKDMWGYILNELEKDTKSDKLFLGYLNYLREMRNKLQHPDIRLSLREAEQVFMHVLGIIDFIIE